ncbi:MAG TPA: hypothetical protein VFV95_15645 [Vicinamibacterales bacterium]|nr:hypothetical protein [Vicinamibacterales bacterium]
MSFWDGLLKAAIYTGGAVAAPYTGGLSMAGAGAAAGALDGGWKGALAGGAAGAIPVGGNALGSALGAGAKAATEAGATAAGTAATTGGVAASSTFSNPKMWVEIGNILGKVAASRAANRPSIGELTRANLLASGESLFNPGPASAPRTDAERRMRQAGTELEQDLRGRMTPSVWDDILNYAAPAMSMYGTYLDARR